MKKNIIYLMFVALFAITLTSCDDSSEGLTRITYYPVLTLNGDEVMHADKGSTFTDPGCSAELNGEDVSADVKVSGTVNTAKSGVYTLTYSVANADGFSASAQRTVIVTDPNDAHEGVFYVSTADSYRVASATAPYKGAFEIVITSNDDGTYHVDDLLGGWYSQGAGYGTAYAMDGKIAIGDDEKITLVDCFLTGWGDSLDSLDGKFDVATGTYNWTAEYAGMTFVVVLTK